MTTTTSHAKPILVGAALLAFFTLFTLAIAGLHSQGAHPLPKAQPTTTQPAPEAPDVQGYLQALTNNGVASWLSDGEATHNGAGGFLAWPPRSGGRADSSPQAPVHGGALDPEQVN